MYYFAGKDNLAIKQYKQALSINPEEPMAHNNIGVIYLKENKLTEAEKEFKKELIVNPGYDKALDNLTKLYHQENKVLEDNNVR